MKRNLTALFFCLTLLGPAALAQAEAGKDAASQAVQTAFLQNDTVRSQPLAADATAALKNGAGNLFNNVRISSVPSMCALENETVYYSYSEEAAEPVLPACSSESADALASMEHRLLTEIAISETLTAEEAAAELASELDSLPGVPIIVNKNVESFIRYFQTNGRKYFEKWLGRSKDYMSMLRTILRESGVPEDLSYIAFIESGLNPTVKSHANAVGMWQFIRGTALRYGLRVDWWIDERMDPEKATYAAAKYFKNLYGMFDSWYLAAASYNAGEGRVARAIKKHGTEDFWVLASQKKPLHRETRDYVPKYLAAVTIAKDPELYGFDVVEYNEGLRYDKVKVAQATDLRVIAEAAGTSVEEIKKLNPELLRWFTPPNYPNYQVKIPEGRAEIFMANMSKVPSAKKIAFLQHKVKRGETISRISKRYGTGIKPILYLNNIKGTKLKPGTTIMIPVRADDYVGRKKGKAVAEIVTRMELHS